MNMCPKVSVYVLYTCISPKAPGILQYRHFAVFHVSRWDLERINRDKRGNTVHLRDILKQRIKIAPDQRFQKFFKKPPRIVVAYTP